MAWVNSAVLGVFYVALMVGLLVLPCTALAAFVAGAVLLGFPSVSVVVVFGLLAIGMATDGGVWVRRASRLGARAEL